MLIYNSPRLIAVSHVLLRLLMPRHSPYALSSLNFLKINLSINALSFIANNFLTVVFSPYFALLAKFVVIKLHHIRKDLLIFSHTFYSKE